MPYSNRINAFAGAHPSLLEGTGDSVIPTPAPASANPVNARQVDVAGSISAIPTITTETIEIDDGNEDGAITTTTVIPNSLALKTSGSDPTSIIASIMTSNNHITTIPVTTLTPNPSARPTPGTSPTASSRSISRIIGGAIGGALGLILSLLLLALFLRHRRKSWHLLDDGVEAMAGPIFTDTSQSLPIAKSKISPSAEVVVENATKITPFHMLAANPSSPHTTAPPNEDHHHAVHSFLHQAITPLDSPATAPSGQLYNRIAAILNSPGTGIRARSDDRNDLHTSGILISSDSEVDAVTFQLPHKPLPHQDIDLIVARVVEVLNAQDVGGTRVAQITESGMQGAPLPKQSNYREQREGHAPGFQRKNLPESRPDSGSTVASTAPPMYEE